MSCVAQRSRATLHFTPTLPPCKGMWPNPRPNIAAGRHQETGNNRRYRQLCPMCWTGKKQQRVGERKMASPRRPAFTAHVENRITHGEIAASSMTAEDPSLI
ncbi:hypothetical protein DPEC_G00112210 [Dallia pectoralis]|uniref:Uncharacterized protein n=1 Tax=Dallia pectoralis TaxID=75939 RepID=A0ACC2GT95_DALPE|nr:hypothetical protein DPEC_G00112210 [Dallia pectoralis]